MFESGSAAKSGSALLGSGCAFIDYDDDGDQDILLLDAEMPTANGSIQGRIALYANDGAGRFREVTAGSGLDVDFNGMGVAVGDYDNDGYPDIFLTSIGQNRLFHNEALGRFRDVTKTAGVGGRSGQTTLGASWLDYDNDGLLDLFVCDHGTCADANLSGNAEEAGPVLYHNESGGKFRDVSISSGLTARRSGSFIMRCVAVAPVDLDDDGWIDLVVSNDGGPNLVFHNEHNGKFAEIGTACGIAYDGAGNVSHGRGIDVAWCRDDACLTVAIGAGESEMLKLFARRSRRLQFSDQSIDEGIAPLTRKHSTFGVLFLDYDLDGWPDLLAVNGPAGPDHSGAERAQLFWNGGPRIEMAFQPVGETSGGDLLKPMIARGAACADIDGDGDLDLLITQNGRPPVLLRNDQPSGRSLRLKLIGSRSARDAIGARITLRGPKRYWRGHVMPTRGYLSQSELPVTFGFGHQETPKELELRWPSGTVQKLRVRTGERQMTIIEPSKVRFVDNH